MDVDASALQTLPAIHQRQHKIRHSPVRWHRYHFLDSVEQKTAINKRHLICGTKDTFLWNLMNF